MGFHYRDGAGGLEDYLCRRGLDANAPAVHLLLQDLNLGAVDGRDVVRRLRQEHELGALPIVMFTQVWSETTVRSCYQAGANAVMIKPVGFHQFVESIQSLTRFWFQTAALVHEPGTE
ncbi:MAG: response regulator [Proteobacteria bacterium]|nr:response regulator [Pseudomonadota bacterium]